jgi:hypothetical protein
MSTSITPVQPSASTAPATAVQAKTPQAKAASPVQDTVQLSEAALAALLAKPAEATETSAQTLQEAGGGDPKAIALLAKK